MVLHPALCHRRAACVSAVKERIKVPASTLDDHAAWMPKGMRPSDVRLLVVGVCGPGGGGGGLV